MTGLDAAGNETTTVPLPDSGVVVVTPQETATAGGLVGTLTEGTGISRLTSSKFIKDVVVDFLLSLPPALLAVNIGGIPTDRAAAVTAVITVGGVILGALYRGALRWGTTTSPTP